MRQNLKWLLIGLFQKRDMETMIKRGRVLSKLLGQIYSIGENRIWTRISSHLSKVSWQSIVCPRKSIMGHFCRTITLWIARQEVRKQKKPIGWCWQRLIPSPSGSSMQKPLLPPPNEILLEFLLFRFPYLAFVSDVPKRYHACDMTGNEVSMNEVKKRVPIYELVNFC